MNTVVRLIQKKAIKNKEGKIDYDVYDISAFLKIVNNKKLILCDDKNFQNEYNLDDYDYIFFDRYNIYTIDELKEIYNKLNNTNQSIDSISLKKIYNEVPIYNIMESLFKKKESEILQKIEIVDETKRENKQDGNNNKKTELDNKEDENKNEK